ncbi:MAG: efflux RND transporter permease subunit [Planctomycetota bacterium]|jgi:CzcA family heavy metal efflux pump
MINALIRWSLSNRLAVLIVSCVLLVGGIYATSDMPVDVFPDLTAPTVTVLVEGHGMAPEEMETLVTFPIETAVNGAADVRRVRSSTAVGFSTIWVEFEWGTDIYRARQTVTERLAAVAGKLPENVEPPVLAPMSSVMGEILFASITSDRHSALELRTLAGTDVRRRILSVPGVAEVALFGGDEKQYQVVLSPAKLYAYQVSITEVADALRQSNENVAAGFLVEGGQESILQGVGRVGTMQDIAETVVVVRNETPIKVGDLGTVIIGSAIRRGTGWASRRGPDWEPIMEPGVIMAVLKQPGANTLEVTERLDRTFDEIQAAFPEGMVVNKGLFRQADFINASVSNTIEALRDGGLMVIIVILVFLASVRSSFITLLAIPLSLVTAILTLRAFGASINTMTLGGMAIAIGVLVDDAVIEVENIVRRLRENRTLPDDKRRSVTEVIYSATVEVRASVVFATVIILIVFCPLFFLSGVEGRLLRPLGVAFTVSLAASMVVALAVTPALCLYLLPRSLTVTRGVEPYFVRVLKRLYAPLLDRVLRHPWWIGVPTAALAILALVGAGRMGRSFLPEFSEGALVVGLVSVPGISLQESDRLAHVVEETLMSHPEIAAIGRRTGRGEADAHGMNTEGSEIDLTLDMEAPKRLGLQRRSRMELLEALRADVSTIPGVQATFGQPIGHRIDHMLSGTRANIAVKIFGEDLYKLRALAKDAEAVMTEIPGVVDLTVEQQNDVPIHRVEFDRPAIARYGLQVQDVAAALQAGFRGDAITQILEGRNSFDLVLRVGDAENPDAWTNAHAEMVEDILVDTPSGAKIPLKALARISREVGPNMISRENARRKIVVMCNVANRALGDVVADIQRSLSEQIALPPGYYVEYGGQFESAEATRNRLSILGVIVLLGIGFLLYTVFRSHRDALLIMVNLPLALIGGVAGVYVSGGVLSVASVIGFISVFGIAARNGIMLVSHIRHLQQFEGIKDFDEAVRRGAMERLAPILMTALAAGLALVPLAIGGEQPGREILTPMAIVILCGLLSSTFLNMIVVPVLFLRFGKPMTAEPAGSVRRELPVGEPAVPPTPA